jgi:hypothetical protein
MQWPDHRFFRRLQCRLERFQARFFQKHESLQVVAGRFQMQSQGGADDTHATHQLAAHLCQRAEHMFDAGARRGDTAVAPLLCFRDAVRGIAFALDVHAPAGLRQVLFALDAGVAAIGIHIAAGVGGIEQHLKPGGVSDGSVSDDQFAYQLTTLVDAGVQLITKVALAMFLRPAGVDDLAAARQVAVLLQLLLNLVEHECTSTGLGQAVAEEPDRLGVGDTAALGQAEKQ